MEPPIQGLKRRSMVLLLAISLRRMLCGGEGEKGRLGTTGGQLGAQLRSVFPLSPPDIP